LGGGGRLHQRTQRAQDVRGREGVTLLPFPAAVRPLSSPVPRCGAARWAGAAHGAGRRRAGRGRCAEAGGERRAGGPGGRGAGRSASKIVALSLAAPRQNKSLLLHVWYAQVKEMLRYESTVD